MSVVWLIAAAEPTHPYVVSTLEHNVAPLKSNAVKLSVVG